MQNFFATTLPGIGAIAQKQLAQKWGAEYLQTYELRNNDLLKFSYDEDWRTLLSPSSLEDIYLPLHTMELTGRKSDLIELRKFCRLIRKQTLFDYSDKRVRSLRVVAMAGDKHWRKYRRMDMERAAILGLEENLQLGLPVKPEETSNEIWLFQVEKVLIICLRLSDNTLRNRASLNYKGALRPSIANAMVFISNPQPSDVFLDPMCAAGSTLLERDFAGQHGLMYGFDNNPDAVNLTLANLGSGHKPWRVEEADAQDLPLTNDSVDVVVTNTPWGVQTVTGSTFYPEFYAEMSRVLKPGGRIVLLGKEVFLGKQKLTEAGLQLREIYKNISILGQTVEIVVAVKL
jgi:tRNA (guanine6-N2)-methyltransferase